MQSMKTTRKFLANKTKESFSASQLVIVGTMAIREEGRKIQLVRILNIFAEKFVVSLVRKDSAQRENQTDAENNTLMKSAQFVPLGTN